MNKNTIIISVISVVVIFGFLVGVYMLTNSSSSSSGTISKEAQTITPADHIKWSPEKKNILVEYSDLQCPACKAFHDMIKNQIEASGSANTNIIKKVTFIYRHFPLDQHPFSHDAAYSAEAAGKQGKFYEMSDLLFANQETWSKTANPKEDFVKYAQQLNLNIDQFKKDSDLQEVKNKVNQDYQSGIQAGVNSTPTFYLNGKKLDNVASFNDFVQLLKGI